MKPEYSRTTITVPWQLKKRMKQAGARVNWSAIACEAFEEKLEEIGPVEEIKSVEAALERMRSIATEKEETFEESRTAGKEAGRHWALNFALPEQLKRIAELKKKVDDNDSMEWSEFLLKPHGRVRLAMQIGLSNDLEGEFPWGRGPRGEHHRRRRRGPGGHGGPRGRGEGREGRGGRGRGGRHRGPGPEGMHDQFGQRSDGPPPRGPGQGHDPDMERQKMERERESRMIWRSILHQRPAHPSFFAGFAEAVLEVWDELKDKFE